MDASVDKGNALRTLQQVFGVAKEETMAFGDNTNDIGLMQAAGLSYAVENARPEVKAAAVLPALLTWKRVCGRQLWRDVGKNHNKFSLLRMKIELS